MSFDDMDMDRLRQEIDGVILDYMPETSGYSAEVRKAMSYAIASGGKRVRPMLMMLTYRAMGGKGDIVEPFAAAIEMVHTHSLIHDDLPDLDNDSLRHGKPSVHVQFGEDVAILAGDALLNLAYETAALGFIKNPGSKTVERAFALLAKKSGIHGMLGGQSADVVLTGKVLDEKQMKYIYEKKTAALMEAPMMIGACLAGADEKTLSDIKIAGRAIGLAFQVRDDVLDMTASAEKIGKEVGQDARNEKTTYASLNGLDAAEEYIAKKTDLALDILSHVIDENANKDAKLLKKLICQLAGRDK